MSRTSSATRRPSASRPKLVHREPIDQPPLDEKLARKQAARSKPTPRIPIPQSPLQREFTTKRRGELAELTFVLKAASLGFAVAKPYGDSERYDFILDPRAVRVEQASVEQASVDGASVEQALLPAALDSPAASGKKHARKKNARKKNAKKTPPRKQPVPAPCPPSTPPLLWRVQVKCSTQLLEGLYRVNAHRRINGRAVPYLPSEIDFFAAYIIPEDTWYILPLAATRGRTGLLFRRKRDRKPGLYDAYREAWHLLRPQHDSAREAMPQ